MIERAIFEDECAEAGAPPLIPFRPVMCGPVIIRYGSAAQKAYHLPRILSGEIVWCQGFSEPGLSHSRISINCPGFRFTTECSSARRRW